MGDYRVTIGHLGSTPQGPVILPLTSDQAPLSDFKGMTGNKGWSTAVFDVWELDRFIQEANLNILFNHKRVWQAISEPIYVEINGIIQAHTMTIHNRLLERKGISCEPHLMRNRPLNIAYARWFRYWITFAYLNVDCPYILLSESEKP